MNDSAVSELNPETWESIRKAAACRRNIVTNTAFLPMASENHAHRNRPEPLAIEMIPTSAAAVVAVTCDISWAIGEACEMMAIPAVLFRKSVSHNPYHCQDRSACGSVKRCADKAET